MPVGNDADGEEKNGPAVPYYTRGGGKMQEAPPPFSPAGRGKSMERRRDAEGEKTGAVRCPFFSDTNLKQKGKTRLSFGESLAKNFMGGKG